MKGFAEKVARFARAVEQHDGRAFATLLTPDDLYHDAIYGAVHSREAIEKKRSMTGIGMVVTGFEICASRCAMPSSLAVITKSAMAHWPSWICRCVASNLKGW